MPVEGLPEGGPAFPYDDQGKRTSYSGMTLRDWFAGMAMLGEMTTKPNTFDPAMAYGVADAMLAERNK